MQPLSRSRAWEVQLLTFLGAKASTDFLFIEPEATGWILEVEFLWMEGSSTGTYGKEAENLGLATPLAYDEQGRTRTWITIELLNFQR